MLSSTVNQIVNTYTYWPLVSSAILIWVDFYLFIYCLKGQVPSGLIFPSNLKVLLWARFSLDLLVTMPQ